MSFMTSPADNGTRTVSPVPEPLTEPRLLRKSKLITEQKLYLDDMASHSAHG